MKSKSNPLGLRKGHWVSKPFWANAYKISRVKNGMVLLIVNGREFGRQYSAREKMKDFSFVRVNPKKTEKILNSY